jgi:thioredoxin-related protein
MKAKLILPLFFILIFSCSPKPKNPGEGMIYFSGNFDQAVEKASTENKKIFIYGHTDWCGYCRKMEKSTFKEKEVNDFMNANFVSLNYDLEKGEGIHIAAKYGLKSYPAYVLLSPKGELLSKTGGYINQETFLGWVKSNP